MPFPILARSLLVAALVVSALAAGAQERSEPLNQAEVVLLLKSGVSPVRVRSLVHRLGIDFVVDEPALGLLRAAGADQALIGELQRATAAPRSGPESPHPPTAGAHPQSPQRTTAMPSPSPSPTSVDGDFVAVPLRPGVYMARREVTRRQYLAYCDRYRLRHPKDPPLVRSQPDHPIVNVTWEEAVAYCRRLSQEKNWVYRLPTETEWELVATEGHPRRTYPWPEGADPKAYACFGGKDLCSVGSRLPNALGVYDLAGNAAEWVTGEDGKPVAKGGSWAMSGDQAPDFAISHGVRTGSRKSSYEVGFRVALVR